MKILIINKFLHPIGGAETYIFKLGRQLEAMGHEVQYFGMEHPGRCVGNRVNAYTSDMDLHIGPVLSQLRYAIKVVYSSEARRKLRLILEDMQPDVIHINNFNYQLTPSILLEIQKWRREGHELRVVFTAHDYQLVCPNHMCNDPNTGENCEKCIGGHYGNCAKHRCIHGSRIKSITGSVEAWTWSRIEAYKAIDVMICCSKFMKSKLDTDARFADKTVVMHNFVERLDRPAAEKKDYVLYFGRYSEEKGLVTLMKAAEQLPEVRFLFAGAGPMEAEIKGKNIQNVGFKTGEELICLVSEARFSVCPSEWYENCPFSVLESVMLGTPVIGARIGGIPELIEPGRTGELFESGNADELRDRIRELWDNRELAHRYSVNCRDIRFDTVEEYAEKLMAYYRG